ncbi:MAG: transcription termination/antitermination factor NusG [Nitrospirae bacterium]|nr:transcription termination/antitermination factor NusG [Nitrospirota bacterium]
MSKKWYVIHTLSGCENKVRASLEGQIDSLSLQDSISRVLIPTEEVAEVRGGEKRVTTRNLFPGYVFVEMELNEKTWHLVKNISGVSGFISSGKEPVPLEDREVENILKAVEEKRAKPTPKVVLEKGERIRVVEGPFTNLNGVVEETNPERGKVKVMVSIFGRSTPVELEYWQVEVA